MFYYVLLYKIKSSDYTWIVKTDLNYDDLINDEKLERLKRYYSDVDQYYIVKQNRCNIKDVKKILDFKHFTQFYLDKNSEIIFKTE